MMGRARRGAQRFGAGTDWLGAGRLGEAWWAAIVRRHHLPSSDLDDSTDRQGKNRGGKGERRRGRT